MSVLRLFTSNRMEVLAEALAKELSTPLSSVFETEVIIVQSRGMERWISMDLAERHGICANIRFPFPNAFMAEVLKIIFPDLPEQSPFDPEILTWRIMKILPSLVTRPGFEPISTYLENAASSLKRFQLSARIADLFDQYLLFRPEMILKWEKGRENYWQAVLWRELVQGYEGLHRAALGKALIERLMNASRPFKDLPERISVFGISTLPRFHIQVLAALARYTRISLFIMNPCREYWGHITSDSEMERIIRKGETDTLEPQDLHLEKGNPLLASMGKLGGDFFDLIHEFDYDDIALFREPENAETKDRGMLFRVQSDILNLRDRGQKYEGETILSEHDTSIQIHSCHSPMREVEVLHDRLLRMFQTNPDLKPKDILVMMPDIEAYSPYIKAVFGATAGESAKIPFSIADQSVRTEGKIIEPFLLVLKLNTGRFTALEVLTLLESQAVLNRFGLSGPDLAVIRRWVEDTRIRWGVNGPHRRDMGLPEYPENTWRAGLDRLVLGYAMNGRGQSMFSEILPFDNMEGSDTRILGHFLSFVDTLFQCAKRIGQPRTLLEWSQVLKEIFDALFLPDDIDTPEARIIQRTFYTLAENQQESGFDEKVEPEVISHILTQYLEKEGFGFGFITGGVTFCAMLPMRSIPFKIICLLGLSSDSYPRQSKTLGFDLMVKHPKKGDRSRRNDDRYLFLEAILSARHTLYISYVGKSLRDNTPIVPSVLISELLEYLSQGFIYKGVDILDGVVTQHPLQPFNPRHFTGDPKVFSFSRIHFETACRLTASRKEAKPFISTGLPDPETEWRNVQVDDLCRFFENPAKFLLQKRLGMNLDGDPEMSQDTEPFRLAGLDQYVLAQDMVDQGLSKGDLKEFYHIARAKGLLPHGTVGEITYERLRREVESFCEKTESYLRQPPLPPLNLDLRVAEFRLEGRLHPIYPGRMLRWRYAQIKPRDRLRAWIYHLLLNCAAAEGYPKNTAVIGLDPEWTVLEYPAVPEAEKILAQLLKHYWEGLIRPIHFFPKSSWHYAQLVIERQRPVDDALAKAAGMWEGSLFVRGEKMDPYYRLCFEKVDPIDREFQDRALDIFESLVRLRQNDGMD